MKKLLLAAMLAATFGGLSVPASADVVIVRQAPPPPRDEVIPAPRHGYLWIPGHWDWKRNHHIWVRGAWVRERHGYVYHQPTWVERDGRWELARGSWVRGDRDGDGVPNRVDHHPNNPNRQ